ncbi:MAG TPA: flagellar hook-basal body protein [Clostridiales bacterium]|nr:flagellar hook-basal body protein [Clostridiales bacterium]
MITSFYTGATGAIQSQRGLDVAANNIANMSTNGYKAQRVTFEDLLYTNMRADNQELKAGHGAKLSKTDVLHTGGAPRATGRDLDFAVFDARSFFGVMTEEGIQYTKNGNFSLSQQADGKFYLAYAGVGNVVDAAGNPIEVDPNQYDQREIASKIGVFTFANIDGLTPNGSCLFSATATSGNPTVVAQPQIQTGYLESSAVDIADEMVEVIQLQKAFQLNTRMVQISDEIMQTVNNLR